MSLLLMKIFTWKSDYVFTICRAIHTIKGDNSKCNLFFRIMPLFRLDVFILYKFYMGLYRENFINLPVPSHRA